MLPRFSDVSKQGTFTFCPKSLTGCERLLGKALAADAVVGPDPAASSSLTICPSTIFTISSSMRK
jgi:hypothetical protein